MLNVTVDGKTIQVREGMPVLAACRKAGAYVPTLCALKGTSNIGSCRICSVAVEGLDHLVAACNTPCEDGMVIHTDTPEVVEFRKIALDLIISEHGLDSTNYCFSCKKNGACELQAVARALGVEHPSFTVEQTRKPVFDSNPFLRFDPNLCIKCQRCVGACNNAARNHTLHTGKKGLRTTIVAPFGEDWRATECESCGNCAQACPTGALTEKRRDSYIEWDVRRVRTTCPHCAIGCQMDLKVKGNKIVDVEAVNGPSNQGLLCVKGRSASFDFVSSPERLTSPLIKNAETGEFEEATWDDALAFVAKRFTEIKERDGGDALAAFACSRSTNEDIYLLEKMARTVFGTNNVDNCARV